MLPFGEKFVTTRPKSPYGRQGLAGSWGKDSVWRVQFLLSSFGAQLVWSKKHYVTDREIQLTSFDPKNVTLPTGGSNWPSLVQKRDVTNRGVQLTF